MKWCLGNSIIMFFYHWIAFGKFQNIHMERRRARGPSVNLKGLGRFSNEIQRDVYVSDFKVTTLCARSRMSSMVQWNSMIASLLLATFYGKINEYWMRFHLIHKKLTNAVKKLTEGKTNLSIVNCDFIRKIIDSNWLWLFSIHLLQYNAKKKELKK